MPLFWAQYFTVSALDSAIYSDKMSQNAQISHSCSWSPLGSAVSPAAIFLFVGRHCPLAQPSLTAMGIAWHASFHSPNSSVSDQGLSLQPQLSHTILSFSLHIHLSQWQLVTQTRNSVVICSELTSSKHYST